MNIQHSATPGSQADTVVDRLAINVPEFAIRYGVSVRTVWTWLADGLPHYKLSPRQTRIPLREADEWMNKNFLRKRKR